MQQGTETGGWSSSGKLNVGGPGFGAGANQAAVSLQVDFTKRILDLDNGEIDTDQRQRPASVYTVQFDIDTSDFPTTLGTAAPFVHVNPIAIIEASTNGNTVRRTISVANGTSISLVCDFLHVKVVDATPNGGGGAVPPGTNLAYVVGILATPGVRPARHVPPYLVSSPFNVAIAGGDTAIVAIPITAGIHTFAVFATQSGGGVPLVRQMDFATTLLAEYDPQQPIFVPVIPTAAFLEIANTGPVASNINVQVVFGIDG